MSSLAAMLASLNDPCGLAARARNLLLPGSDEVQPPWPSQTSWWSSPAPSSTCWFPSAVGVDLLVDPGGRHRLGAQFHRPAPSPTPRALAPTADPVLSWYQAAPAPPRPVDTSWGQLHDDNTTSALARRLGDGRDHRPLAGVYRGRGAAPAHLVASIHQLPGPAAQVPFLLLTAPSSSTPSR